MASLLPACRPLKTFAIYIKLMILFLKAYHVYHIIYYEPYRAVSIDVRVIQFFISIAITIYKIITFDIIEDLRRGVLDLQYKHDRSPASLRLHRLFIVNRVFSPASSGP